MKYNFSQLITFGATFYGTILYMCIILILVLVALNLFQAAMYKKWHQRQYEILNQHIKNSVEEKFLTITPDSQALIEMAIEVWRLGKRLKKIEPEISADQNSALQNSFHKLQRFLLKHDLSIQEYTGQKYNQGMNLDVLTAESDPSVGESFIRDTVEPAVMKRGQLLKRAKVIIVEQ